MPIAAMQSAPPTPTLAQVVLLAEANKDVIFLAINFDENKALARGVGVKVLPFFHLYRGAEGRVDAFSASVSKVQRLRCGWGSRPRGVTWDTERGWTTRAKGSGSVGEGDA